jgi:hypothetical protein
MGAPLLVAEQNRVLVFRGGITGGVPLGAPAPLSSPGGLVATVDGLVAVADQALGRLAVLDLLTRTWTTLFTPGPADEQLNRPSDVTMDSSGRWLIADRGNRRIVRCNADGSGWVAFGEPGRGAGQFVDPTSVAMDGRGRIVVADPGAGRVIRIDDMDGSGWAQVALPAPPDPELASFPVSVTAAGPNRWAVADVGVRQVYLLDLDDTVVGAVPAEARLLIPTYVSGSATELVVGDPAINEVQSFTIELDTLVPSQRWRGSDPSLPAPVFEQLAGICTFTSERA